MENNVLNIIQNHLQNSLVIDDTDSSILYRHTEADTDIDIKGKIDKIMNDIIADNKQLDVEYIKTIIDMHGNYRFKPADIWDIEVILYKFNLMGIQEQLLDLLDISNVITCILADGREVPVHTVKNRDYEFLKVSTKQTRIADCDILIPARWKEDYWQQMKWTKVINDDNENKCQLRRSDASFKMKPADELCTEECVQNDYNGYKSCERLFKRYKCYKKQIPDDFPALKYVCGLSKNIGGETYAGYIPSVGQMKILIERTNIINFFCHNLLNISSTYNIWTSNYAPFYSNDYNASLTVWKCSFNIFAEFFQQRTIAECYVFPLFKKAPVLFKGK